MISPFAQSSEEATHSDVSVAPRHRDALQSVFDEVRLVDVMDSGDTAHLSLMKRPDLGVTLTKLHCWTLTQYSKCVFMDADTLVRNNETLQRLGVLSAEWMPMTFLPLCPGSFKHRRAL